MGASTNERRHEIVQLVLARGNVRVDELAVLFRKSEVAIRTDLNALADRGLLHRVRGGAIAESRILQELPVSEKAARNRAVKRKLAEAACKFVHENDAIILDSGTTTAEIAACLADVGNLTVMTNGLNVALNLVDAQGVEVMMTGGKMRKKSQSFVGGHAEEALSRRSFDTLFLGVDGIDMVAGFTTHFEYEAVLNRKMCRAARQIVAVADSSKFNRSSLHRICGLADIAVMITDIGIPEAFARIFRRHGVQVVLVDLETEGD